MSTESVMPSNHLILCCPLLLLPSIFPSIRVFSNELPLHLWWSKYCSFSFSIIPSNGYSGLISLEGNSYPLQHSGRENAMDCIVHGLTKSWTRLNEFHFTSFRIDWFALFAVQGTQESSLLLTACICKNQPLDHPGLYLMPFFLIPLCC